MLWHIVNTASAYRSSRRMWPLNPRRGCISRCRVCFSNMGEAPGLFALIGGEVVIAVVMVRNRFVEAAGRSERRCHRVKCTVPPVFRI